MRYFCSSHETLSEGLCWAENHAKVGKQTAEPNLQYFLNSLWQQYGAKKVT